MRNAPATERVIRTERLEIVDKHGRVHLVMGAEQGKPYVAQYDGQGRILRWVTVLVNGMLSIRLFLKGCRK